MIGKTVLHYKILKKLGEGGMGVVYKAEDTKLERTVAIKFLPKHVAASEEERERFKVEAKAAAALNHPNIATIHAIEEIDDEMFIVMEYIEGRELQEIIGAPVVGAQARAGKRPAPRLDQILDYATQIASGLEGAHKKGVTHRDIKSSNIMITEEGGQVKIMDFGLAKVRGGPQMTKLGTTLGTAAYMSPEQARGEETGHQTDIWAFGVVLYEMLTGKLPFPGDYEQAVIYSILNESPAHPGDVRQEVPANVSQIVLKCLEKDQTERYQKTAELSNDLANVKGVLESGGVRDSFHGGSKASPRFSRFAVAGLATLLALLLILLVFKFVSKQSDVKTSGPTREGIAVMYFENNTDNEQMKWFSRGLPHMLITELEHSQEVKVLGYQRMYDILKGMGKNELDQIDRLTASAVAQKAGVEQILYGSIFKAGENIRIDFRLEDVSNGELLLADKVSGVDVLQMADEIGDHIVELFRAKPSPAPAEPTAMKPTTNIEAYRHFFLGEEQLNLYHWPVAQAYFEQAVALDSTFALAYYKLYLALRWQSDLADLEVLNEAKLRALEKALQHQQKLSDRDLRLTRAAYDLVQSGAGEDNYARTVPLFREIADDHPDDKYVLYELSEAYFHTQQYEQTLAAIERIITLDPEFAFGRVHLVETYFSLGEFEKAKTEVEQRMEGPKDVASRLLLGDSYILLGEIDRGFAEYDTALAYAKPTSIDLHPYSQVAAANFLIGRYQQAERTIAKLLDLSQSFPEEFRATTHVVHMALGHMHELLGDSTEALTHFRRALESDPTALRVYRDLGSWYARHNDLPRAQAMLDTVQTRLKGQPHRYSFKIRGEMALARKNYPEAIRLLEQQSVGRLYRYPLLEAYVEDGDLENAVAVAQELSEDEISGGPGGPGLNWYHTLYYPYCLYQLGILYERTKRPLQAIDTYAKLLKLWERADADLPMLIDAKRRLRKLESMSEK